MRVPLNKTLGILVGCRIPAAVGLPVWQPPAFLAATKLRLKQRPLVSGASFHSRPPRAVFCTSARTMGPDRNFTDHVVDTMKELYPLEHADTAWDNVGLLLGNFSETEPVRKRVLLTTDLTANVVDEAIQYDVSVIVAYHPIIFRGLKAITPEDSQQASLIRLAQKNIAVYCPHTALDAAVGGLNDWLIEKVLAAALEGNGSLNAQNCSTRTLKRICGQESAVGYGRQVDFGGSVDAFALVRGMASRLGGMRHVLIAPPADYRDGHGDLSANYLYVRSVAVCAGSGADVLKKASFADMLFTGEMSHHDALAATSKNKWVVCVLHSNSERLFLAEKLKGQLQRQLGSDARVLVSQADRDPFLFWDVNEPPPRPRKPLPEAYTV